MFLVLNLHWEIGGEEERDESNRISMDELLDEDLKVGQGRAALRCYGQTHVGAATSGEDVGLVWVGWIGDRMGVAFPGPVHY